MYTDLQVRGIKKAVFRRLTSKLNIHKALDSKDDAKSALVELKKAFTAFQEAHDVVCVSITDFGEQLKEEQEFIDVQLQYTQCLNDINSWLYGDNSDVSYAKPSLAINSSAVNVRDAGKSQGDNRGKQSICLKCHAVHPLHAEEICCKQCNLNHSTYTHVDDVIVNKNVDVNTVMPSQMQTTNSAGTAGANSADDMPSSDYTFMSTVSVVVNESYKTHALLDSDSTNSFITSDAVTSLGLSSKTVIYRHSTVDAPCITTSTKVVSFILYSLDGSKSLTMSNVFVVEEVPYTYSPCRDLSAYPHLSDIPISPVHPPAKVDILIGQDNSEALVPLQVLKGNPGDPFYVLTKFGWTLNSVFPGSSTHCVSHCVVSNFVHTSIDAKVEVLSDTADDHVDPTLKSLSVSIDCKVLDICYGESDHVDNNFPAILSNCYKPLLTSVGMYSVVSDYDNPVKAVISQGFVEEIHFDAVQNLDPMTWYVPYYPVLNSSSDAHISFDDASRLLEYSHNDGVIYSPLMNNNLSYVNDCLLSVISTEEMSNLVIKSGSMFCDFDPRKCLLYDPPMFRLIPDYNMSLDSDSIVTAHSQLVSKILGVLWVMPLKQWLSWLKSFGSWINNTCLVLCYTFEFDNG